jgi:hypothetical protein
MTIETAFTLGVLVVVAGGWALVGFQIWLKNHHSAGNDRPLSP